MNSYWHRNTLGKYMPKDNHFGLDFFKLLDDPVLAEITYFHEITHTTLMNTTEFGFATINVFGNLDHMNHLDVDEIKEVESALYSAQLLTQEASATLMEILRLKGIKNAGYARNWAKCNFPEDYYNWYQKVDFVLDLSNKYKDLFTTHVAHIAMHNGLREHIYNNNLLESGDKFTSFMSQWDDLPDERYKKLIKAVKANASILKKDSKSICDIAQINYYPDTTKKTVANYLNYIASLIGDTHIYTEIDISDASTAKKAIEDASDSVIVGNMNLGIEENGMFLWKEDDLVHYSDQVKVVFLAKFSENLKHRETFIQLTNRNPEASIVAFTKTGEKYLYGADVESITRLMNNEFKDKTLITKWGLYNPLETGVYTFPDIPRPNVVIYNSVKNLEDTFQKYLESKNTLEYVAIGYENHPYRTLILKDKFNVLHLLNGFGNTKIESFLNKYKAYLIPAEFNNFLKDTRHINNACNVWMGLDWNVDFYNTLSTYKTTYSR